MLGYTTLTIGIALILRPALRDVAAAAVLGTVVGVLRLLARGRRSLEVLMPFVAAFAVAAADRRWPSSTTSPIPACGR